MQTLEQLLAKARQEAATVGVAGMTQEERLHYLWDKAEGDIRVLFPEALRQYVVLDRHVIPPGDTVRAKIVLFQEHPVRFWVEKLGQVEGHMSNWFTGFYCIDNERGQEEQYADCLVALAVAERLSDGPTA
jgi:hypothetical protein